MEILGFAAGVGSINDSIATGATVYKGDHVLEGMYLIGIGAQFDVTLEKPRQELWVSFYARSQSTTSKAARTMFSLLDSQGIELVKTTVDVNENLNFFYRAADGSLAQMSSFNWESSATVRVDIEFTQNQVSFYWDGILQAQTTDVSLVTYPATTLRFFNMESSQTGYNSIYSAIFAADSDTRDTHMVQHTVTGDGTAHSDFAGDYTLATQLSNYGVTNALSADTAEDTHTFTKSVSPASLTDTHDVVAVGVYSRAKHDGEGAINNLTGVVTDGVNTLEMGSRALSDSIQALTFTAPTAPDGTAWTVEKLDACEVGLRAKA